MPSMGTPLKVRIVRAILRALFKALFRINVQGYENLSAGNYILVANHLNWIDGFLLLAMFPAEPRLYILADKHAICKSRWKWLVLQMVGSIIPIDRSRRIGDGSALVRSCQVLEQGGILGLFPEGKLGSEEGSLERLQRGIGHLCLKSRRLVLPVALSGVSELYLGREITVVIGRPFMPHSEARTVPDRVADIVEQVHRAMEHTLPRYREEPVAHKRLRFLTHLLS